MKFSKNIIIIVASLFSVAFFFACSKDTTSNPVVESAVENSSANNIDATGLTAESREIQCCNFRLSDFTHKTDVDVKTLIEYNNCIKGSCITNNFSVYTMKNLIDVEKGIFSTCKNSVIRVTIKNKSTLAISGSFFLAPDFFDLNLANGGKLETKYNIPANTNATFNINTTSDCGLSGVPRNSNVIPVIP